jgi:hypothetical protein
MSYRRIATVNRPFMGRRGDLKRFGIASQETDLSRAAQEGSILI